MYRMDDVLEQYSTFEITLTGIMARTMPLKVVTRQPNDKPWVTDHYRELVAERQQAQDE